MRDGGGQFTYDCGPRDASQHRLSLPQRFFRPLTIFDIGARSIPLKDISLFVEVRRGAYQKPAIFPVSPTQTHFILRWFPRRHIPAPLLHDPWKVFGMDCPRRLFKCLLQRKARIFQPALIDEIQGAVSQNDPGHRGNCVNYQPELALALPQCVFGLLALGNVLQDAKGPERPAEVVPKHFAFAVDEPRSTVGPRDLVIQGIVSQAALRLSNRVNHSRPVACIDQVQDL